ncbi:MAG TPA: ABC transporter substrate-binding protein [Candidatus Baltobacteraceae bacterium]|nr:ABC transporter substrate-binding protein [Candidatus Baltobacteraceae bacterium]
MVSGNRAIAGSSELSVDQSRREPTRALVLGALIMALAVGAGYPSLAESPAQPVSTAPLKVGYQNSPAMALVIVADSEHYFAKHDINVELKEFTAGKFALQAFLGGSLDVAVAGDVPVGLALLQGQRLVTVAEVLKNSSAEVRVVVRQPGGCHGMTPASYFLGHKRKLATSFGGGPEYFTAQFFAANGIPPSEVELISQKPEEMPVAVDRGAVDGISVFDPAAGEAERLLGPDACTFPDPGRYRQHYVVVVRPAAFEPEPDRHVTAFIDALRDAEHFIKFHPAKARRIVAEKTGLKQEQVNSIWSRYQFGVTLDPSLRTLWAQEADWYHSRAANVPVPNPNYDQAMSSAFLKKGK